VADDLFSRQDELDAETAAARAEEARAAARYRVLCAGRGKVGERKRALVNATHQALAAELELQRAQAERRRGR
jgi:peptidoglycan hydrolase CwlO-like protein